jgi:hypothetical protein
MSFSFISLKFALFFQNGNWTAMVLPVVDTFLPEPERYLPRDPKEVLQTGSYVTMPVLTGTTRHEGAATLCVYQNKILLYFHSVYALFLQKSL